MYTWVHCYDGFIFGVTVFEYRNMSWIKCQCSLKESFSERRVNVQWGEQIPLQISFLNSGINTNACDTEHVKVCSNKYIHSF